MSFYPVEEILESIELSKGLFGKKIVQSIKKFDHYRTIFKDKREFFFQSFIQYRITFFFRQSKVKYKKFFFS